MEGGAGYGGYWGIWVSSVVGLGVEVVELHFLPLERERERERDWFETIKHKLYY